MLSETFKELVEFYGVFIAGCNPLGKSNRAELNVFPFQELPASTKMQRPSFILYCENRIFPGIYLARLRYLSA